MILFRPVNLDELALVYDSGMRAFPPRKPDQPIFHPVLNEEYASEIAEKWNAPGPTRVGYVTQFSIDDGYTGRFDIHKSERSVTLNFGCLPNSLENSIPRY